MSGIKGDGYWEAGEWSSEASIGRSSEISEASSEVRITYSSSSMERP